MQGIHHWWLAERALCEKESNVNSGILTFRWHYVVVSWDGCGSVLISIDGQTQKTAWPISGSSSSLSISPGVLSEKVSANGLGFLALPNSACPACSSPLASAVLVGQGLCYSPSGVARFWAGSLAGVRNS